ncbi:hypothetical protein JYJ95_40545 [Corallococcus exiguus]|uniref:hypothetical protein n=1 Tax=Corallococcus exiguus TaxID=83462 RepID=UPI001A907CE9|nr:hypothetical protein [Corallococcus exiguus]MBN8472833.1 hypothetical protein [Corallococcus exiguus]
MLGSFMWGAHEASSPGHGVADEHEECVEKCWQKRYPWPHSQEQSGWYYKRCVSDCGAQYTDCVKEQEAAAREEAKKLRWTAR